MVYFCFASWLIGVCDFQNIIHFETIQLGNYSALVLAGRLPIPKYSQQKP